MTGCVLVVGDVADDVVVRPLAGATPASDTPARIEQHPGGSAANTAAWLGSLGVRVRFVGRVGAADVDRHRQALAAHGVDARLTADPERTTATIVLMLDEGGERSMYVDRGANVAPPDMPTDTWQDVSWLHLTGYSFFDPRVRPLAVSLLEKSTARGIPCSVDPSSTGFLRHVGRDAFRSWTRGAAVLFPNREEAEMLSGCSDAESAAATLARDYETVVVTCGDAGAVAAGRDGGTARVGAATARVVDTTGAGDAFAAGFLAARLAGGALTDCVKRGAQVAAGAVVRGGGRPGP